MSLLRTAQSSPRAQSGKAASMREKFENRGKGSKKSETTSFFGRSTLGGESTVADSTTTAPELKMLLHKATREALKQSGNTINSSAAPSAASEDQSLQSYMKTLSGSSEGSSFSMSRAFNAAKRKMNKQKNPPPPPPLSEVKTITKGKNQRKASLGGNLQMNFAYTMPIDKVHVQNGQQSVPDPREILAEKSKKEAYAKAEKILQKLDVQQQVKVAKAAKKQTSVAEKLAKRSLKMQNKVNNVKMQVHAQAMQPSSAAASTPSKSTWASVDHYATKLELQPSASSETNSLKENKGRPLVSPVVTPIAAMLPIVSKPLAAKKLLQPVIKQASLVKKQAPSAKKEAPPPPPPPAPPVKHVTQKQKLLKRLSKLGVRTKDMNRSLPTWTDEPDDVATQQPSVLTEFDAANSVVAEDTMPVSPREDPDGVRLASPWESHDTGSKDYSASQQEAASIVSTSVVSSSGVSATVGASNDASTVSSFSRRKPSPERRERPSPENFGMSAMRSPRRLPPSTNLVDDSASDKATKSTSSAAPRSSKSNPFDDDDDDHSESIYSQSRATASDSRFDDSTYSRTTRHSDESSYSRTTRSASQPRSTHPFDDSSHTQNSQSQSQTTASRSASTPRSSKLAIPFVAARSSNNEEPKQSPVHSPPAAVKRPKPMIPFVEAGTISSPEVQSRLAHLRGGSEAQSKITRHQEEPPIEKTHERQQEEPPSDRIIHTPYSDEDEDYYDYEATSASNPLGDIADLALQLLGGGVEEDPRTTNLEDDYASLNRHRSILDDNQRPDAPSVDEDSVESSSLSVANEDFDAVHLDEQNPVVEEDESGYDVAFVQSTVQSSLLDDDQELEVMSSEEFGSEESSESEEDDDDVFDNDHDRGIGNIPSLDNGGSSASMHDRYSVGAADSLDELVNMAASRLSSKNDLNVPSESASYMDMSMEDIFNMATSRLGVSTGQSSNYGLEGMMDFAAGRLSTQSQASAPSQSTANTSLNEAKIQVPPSRLSVSSSMQSSSYGHDESNQPGGGSLNKLSQDSVPSHSSGKRTSSRSSNDSKVQAPAGRLSISSSMQSSNYGPGSTTSSAVGSLNRLSQGSVPSQSTGDRSSKSTAANIATISQSSNDSKMQVPPSRLSISSSMQSSNYGPGGSTSSAVESLNRLSQGSMPSQSTGDTSSKNTAANLATISQSTPRPPTPPSTLPSRMNTNIVAAATPNASSVASEATASDFPDSASEHSNWSSEFFVEAEQEVVFVEMGTTVQSEESQPPSRPAPVQKVTAQQERPLTSTIQKLQQVVQPPTRPPKPVNANPPPAEAFNHPMKALADDLSRSWAPSQTSDAYSSSVHTKDGSDTHPSELESQTENESRPEWSTVSESHQEDASRPEWSTVAESQFGDVSRPEWSTVAESQFEDSIHETTASNFDGLNSDRPHFPPGTPLHAMAGGAFCALLNGMVDPGTSPQGNHGVNMPRPNKESTGPPSKPSFDPNDPKANPQSPQGRLLKTGSVSGTATHEDTSLVSEENRDDEITAGEVEEVGDENTLSDDDDYWDTLSSMKTESVTRSVKNYEPLPPRLALHIHSLSPVAESTNEDIEGCICPWNEHLLLPKHQLRPTGGNGNVALADQDDELTQGSDESFDENIPFEIAYDSKVDVLKIPKKHLQVPSDSEDASGALDNLQSILTESSSSSSDSSLMYSDKHSDDADVDIKGDTNKSIVVEVGGELQEAIKRGQDQALVDSPSLVAPFVERQASRDNDDESKRDPAGAPPLPTLADEEETGIEALFVPKTNRSSFDKHDGTLLVTSLLSRLEATKEEIEKKAAGNRGRESFDAMINGIASQLSSQEGIEMDADSLPVAFSSMDESEKRFKTGSKTRTLNAISKLLSEDQSGDDRDEANELLLSFTRSEEPNDGTASSVSVVESIDKFGAGLELEDVVRPGLGSIEKIDSSDSSSAAVGGSAKRRKMKIDAESKTLQAAMEEAEKILARVQPEQTEKIFTRVQPVDPIQIIDTIAATRYTASGYGSSDFASSEYTSPERRAAMKEAEMILSRTPPNVQIELAATESSEDPLLSMINQEEQEQLQSLSSSVSAQTNQQTEMSESTNVDNALDSVQDSLRTDSVLTNHISSDSSSEDNLSAERQADDALATGNTSSDSVASTVALHQQVDPLSTNNPSYDSTEDGSSLEKREQNDTLLINNISSDSTEGVRSVEQSQQDEAPQIDDTPSESTRGVTPVAKGEEDDSVLLQNMSTDSTDDELASEVRQLDEVMAKNITPEQSEFTAATDEESQQDHSALRKNTSSDSAGDTLAIEEEQQEFSMLTKSASFDSTREVAPNDDEQAVPSKLTSSASDESKLTRNISSDSAGYMASLEAMPQANTFLMSNVSSDSSGDVYTASSEVESQTLPQLPPCTTSLEPEEQTETSAQLEPEEQTDVSVFSFPNNVVFDLARDNSNSSVSSLHERCLSPQVQTSPEATQPQDIFDVLDTDSELPGDPPTECASFSTRRQGRDPSPEKTFANDKGASVLKDRMPSPEKVRHFSPEKRRDPSPEKNLQFASPERRQNLPEIEKYIASFTASTKTTSPEKARVLSPREGPYTTSLLKSTAEKSQRLHRLTVETEHLVPSSPYSHLSPNASLSHDDSSTSSKPSRGTPRLHSILERIGARRKERESRKEAKAQEIKAQEVKARAVAAVSRAPPSPDRETSQNVVPEFEAPTPAAKQTLEQYDTLVDQLLRQNKALKRGVSASETSLGANSSAIKERILELKKLKEKVVQSSPVHIAPVLKSSFNPQRFSQIEIKSSDGRQNKPTSNQHVSYAVRSSSTPHVRNDIKSSSPQRGSSRGRAPPAPEHMDRARRPKPTRSISPNLHRPQNSYHRAQTPTASSRRQPRPEGFGSPQQGPRSHSVPNLRPSVDASKQFCGASPPTTGIRGDFTRPKKHNQEVFHSQRQQEIVYSPKSQDIFRSPVSVQRSGSQRQSPSPEARRKTHFLYSPPSVEPTTPHSRKHGVERQQHDDVIKLFSSPTWQEKKEIKARAAKNKPAAPTSPSMTPYMDRLLAEREPKPVKGKPALTIDTRDTSPSVQKYPTTPSKRTPEHRDIAGDRRLNEHHDYASPSARRIPSSRKKKKKTPSRQLPDHREMVDRMLEQHQEQYRTTPRYDREQQTSPTRPFSSPEKRRLLGSEYSDQAKQLHRELDLARLTSSKIRTSQATLSTELQCFKKKLSKHTQSKRGERAIMAACQSELDTFQQRIQDAKKQMSSDSFSDMTLESTWEDFSEVRGAMLTNLKLMHDAQESLIRERFRMDEDHDDDSQRLQEIQGLMDRISRQERYDSAMVTRALDDAERLGSSIDDSIRTERRLSCGNNDEAFVLY